MKISILLPYKENFSPVYAGAVSLFVKDTTIISKFKKSITVYGNTDLKKIYKINYKNIFLKKNVVQSGSKIYVNEFLKFEKQNPSDLIEIHNRPNYFHLIFGQNKKQNIVLYFHNDPLTMTGSRSVADRKKLLDTASKIIFNSHWSRKRFLEGIEGLHINSEKMEVIYQSTNPVRVDLKKKNNWITFVGKLNRAKGYDLFGHAVIKILKKYKKWKSIVIGDEPREKYSFKHSRLIFTGWISQDKVLNLYSRSSITVVPSLWEEPFGRSSLEAGSRGNAVIISKKGGLPETIENPIFLKKVSANSIYNEIDKLIKNKNLLKKNQLRSFKKPLHTIKNNTILIDNDRKNALFKIKKININKNSKIKILHIFNRAEKMGGRIYFISTGKKIENGLIRLGHDLEGISDRDILSYNSKLNAKKILNRIFLEKSLYYRPDLILLGHVNTIYEESFEKIKNVNKNVIFSQWYEDSLTKNGPDFEKNYENLKTNFKYLDNFFISTHPDDVSRKLNSIKYHFLPTPVDKNIEKLNIYNFKNYTYDVFFAMSHGVNRGKIKPGKKDERESFVRELIDLNKDIKFDVYGYNERNPVWSESFYSAISRSSMAVNLNRGKHKKYSSSNRIASLIGNGLLTFIDYKRKFNHFFNNNEIIFYHNIADLSEKINYYKSNDIERKKISHNGQKKYFKLFNETEIAKYIVNESIGTSKYKPIWHKYLK